LVFYNIATLGATETRTLYWQWNGGASWWHCCDVKHGTFSGLSVRHDDLTPILCFHRGPTAFWGQQHLQAYLACGQHFGTARHEHMFFGL